MGTNIVNIDDEAQFMKKLSNTEAKLKKAFLIKIKACYHLDDVKQTLKMWYEKVFLKVSQNVQENICVGVFSSALSLQLY